MIVNDFFQALRAGKELSNAQTWKDAQQAANSLTALLAAGIGIAAFAGYPVPLTPDQISSLVNGFLVVLGLFNWAATAVSTKRVGLPPVRRCGVSAGAVGGIGAGAVARRAARQGHDAGPADPLPDMSQRG